MNYPTFGIKNIKYHQKDTTGWILKIIAPFWLCPIIKEPMQVNGNSSEINNINHVEIQKISHERAQITIISIIYSIIDN
jgi:hypothetical protein